MKNRLFAILGLVTIGLVVTGGALSVSAKEKPDVVVLIKSTVDQAVDQALELYVSRETYFCSYTVAATFDLKSFDSSEGGGITHQDALLPAGLYLRRVSHYNDGYLTRSQKWIKDRNLRMSGLINNFDTNKSFKTQFLS